MTDVDSLGGNLSEARTLIAYRLERGFYMPLALAETQRDWIDATVDRNASHCLPLLLANQAGWWVLNDDAFEAVWNGGSSMSDIEVHYASQSGPKAACSHFGSGILTFQIPYIFRTPAGWNLHARGPANRPKDGIGALEGIVETDWATVTFTMNWQFTRPGTVSFDAGEPICAISPQRRNDLESFEPVILPATEMPDYGEYVAWRRERHRFREQSRVPDSPESRQQWQRDYMKGNDLHGNKNTEHQTRLKIAEFRSVEPKGAHSAECDVTEPPAKG